MTRETACKMIERNARGEVVRVEYLYFIPRRHIGPGARNLRTMGRGR
ncbi:hypothetical protein [Sphingomonas sanxanigenens]|nr:hypothetical protein [Sphingomonas sanxanigenens]